MFKHKLALALGRTIQEIDEGMSSAEFAQWMMYYQLEPFGAHRDNLHAAIIASLFANAHRGKGKPAFSVDDFMLKDRSEQKKAETAKTLLALDALSVRKK